MCTNVCTSMRFAVIAQLCCNKVSRIYLALLMSRIKNDENCRASETFNLIWLITRTPLLCVYVYVYTRFFSLLHFGLLVIDCNVKTIIYDTQRYSSQLIQMWIFIQEMHNLTFMISFWFSWNFITQSFIYVALRPSLIDFWFYFISHS